jgi:hypothetical protein
VNPQMRSPWVLWLMWFYVWACVITLLLLVFSYFAHAEAHTNCWGKWVSIDDCCGEADVHSAKDGHEFVQDAQGNWYFRGYKIGHPAEPSADGCWTIWYRRKDPVNGMFPVEQPDHEGLKPGGDPADVHFYCLQIPRSV